MKARFFLSSSESLNHRASIRGFTLLELLAVVATTGVLAVLCVGAVHKAMGSANKVREINAARLLTTAFVSSAIDGGGQYLPGMDMRANITTYPVYKSDGQKVENVRAAQRYPFRLAPYLGNSFDGTILVNKNKKEILKDTGGTGSAYDYEVSAYPALGLNIFCVGGVVLANGKVNYDADCISRSANAIGSILVFASGGSGRGKNKMEGYCYVSPPTMAVDSPFCQRWDSSDSWSKEKDPMNYGFVDFRYDDKAVCAFLDGSVRMCSVKDLSDMRVWNRNASVTDDPNYQMVP